uniref:Uncharacterized protein n=1 Tax=Aegilops tauschii subsp. strangulata TaxID=200361 RepID=A0A453ICA8_AEGTS
KKHTPVVLLLHEEPEASARLICGSHPYSSVLPLSPAVLRRARSPACASCVAAISSLSALRGRLVLRRSPLEIPSTAAALPHSSRPPAPLRRLLPGSARPLPAHPSAVYLQHAVGRFRMEKAQGAPQPAPRQSSSTTAGSSSANTLVILYAFDSMVDLSNHKAYVHLDHVADSKSAMPLQD